MFVHSPLPFSRLFLCALLVGACSSGSPSAQDASTLPPANDSGTSQDASDASADDTDAGPDVVSDGGQDATEPVPWNEGQWVVGHARFTAITDTLVRMEYDAEERFVDTPSYFAVERAARFHHALFTRTESGATIDTGRFVLTYTDDGQPFSESNVVVTLKGRDVSFSPAGENPENLGGAVATLDGWSGARRLDDGVLTRAGWYRLDDSAGHLLEDGWVRARESNELDWYLFAYGDDYKAALASLTAIGGAVPMPRKSVLGSWYSRYWPYTTEEFLAIANEYDDHDYPLDVMVLDMDWHLAGWTGWTWNTDLIPDPRALLAELHARGLAVTLNVHPADGVAKHESAYGPFMEAIGQDPASGATVPFDAADRTYMEALFEKVHGPLSEDGTDFFWLDWQQDEFTRGIPTLRHLPWLNELYYRYEARDGRRGLSFSRWGGFGDHRHPIHFSGDAATTFEMLAFEVPFTATSSNAGLFYWSHDIGGHQGARNEESYARWCQFGAFSAALRSHSTRSPDLDRRPWTYADWAEASMKKSFQLRSVFFPYVYSSVSQGFRESLPLIRSLYIDHPKSDAAYLQPQEYMFGDALLVAPITEPGSGPRRLGRQAVWFPEGEFYNFFSSERFEGPSEHLVAATIDEFPLYVRAGVPLPLQPFTRRMATTQTAELVIRCYPPSDSEERSFTFYEDDGETIAYTEGAFATTKLSCVKRGDALTVRVDATEGHFTGQLAQRAYVIEVPATRAATAAHVDGKTANAEYDAALAINRVRVPARDIRSGLEVTVTAPLISSDALALRAFAARTGTTARSTFLATVEAAFQAAASESEKVAVLAAAGVGAFPKNENLYGYPNRPRFVIYERPTVPASVELNTSWLGGVQRQEEASIEFAGERVTSSFLDEEVDFDHERVDLAPLASATFSSQEQAVTRGIADRKVGGYPDDRSEEWSTAGEKVGAYVRLTWSTPQRVARVVLYDRINSNDQITAGTLRFSDGTSLTTGTIPNTPREGPLVVDFAEREVTWLEFTVTGVSATTENVGLAELAVYGN